MDGADVCITSRRPSDVTCGAAILDSRWRRRKWRQPRLGAAFSIPIVVVVENGDPSASGRHLGWPHLRNRKWGHPRWRPEAEGPPFFHHHHNGDRKGRPILLISTRVPLIFPRVSAHYQASLTNTGALRRLVANQREVMTRLLELRYVLNIKRYIF